MKRSILLVLAFIAVIAISVSIARKEPLQTAGLDVMQSDKSLKFSHKFHVKDQGMGCEDCHTTVKASKASSDNLLPGHDVCKTCHADVWLNFYKNPHAKSLASGTEAPERNEAR